MALSVIILGAGKGSRMCSKNPKVLQKLAGKYLVEHVLSTVQKLNTEEVIVVHGHLGHQIQEALYKYDDQIKWVEQKERLGTGHAVLQAMSSVNPNNKVLILYGDVPLISFDTLNHFVDVTRDKQLGILTAEVQNPFGLGRIIRNKYHDVIKIVEEKDATEIDKQITEINTGIYCVSASSLNKWLPHLKDNNSQGEYYLTDVVAMARDEGVAIRVAQPIDIFEISGVNTRVELAQLERTWQRSRAEVIMSGGVSIADPDRIDIRGEVSIGQDTWIDNNVILEGNVSIGENCIIGPGCFIKDTTIGSGVKIKPYSVLEGVSVGSNSNVGPYARLRPGAVLADNVHVGNFVEIKASTLASGVKAGHLSYIGNAEIGEDCNIGAGVITCNYDGAKKHKTVIGADVFVGSNSALVAPVTVASGASIAAGTIVTKTVEEDSLAITRAPQKSIKNWNRPRKNKL